MKNIFTKFSIENFTKNVNTAFDRFPLSFISSVLIFIIFEYTIYNGNTISNTIENVLYKGVLSLVTVYFLSIGLYLLSEKYNFSKLKTNIIQLLSVLFGVFFYFSFEQNLFNNFYSEQLVYIIITYIGVISFVFVSSFINNLINKDIDNDKYYTFFNSVSSKILMSAIVGGALSLLGSIALSAVFALFELNSFIDESKFYGYWIVFSLALFTPIYFLIIAPEKDFNLSLLERIKENKFYNFLSNYIALPFIIIYFFILYAYSLKVLLNFSDWPKGIISWMVIGFSLFGYLIYIFSQAFEIKSSFVRIFRKIFPFAVLFQTPMLFYAIYLRINQYDFTINRYLVVVFGLFLVIVSLYYIFSKKKYLLYISLLLTTFIIIISIGPWGVYSFPEGRQLELLKTDLTTAKILQGREIVLLKNENDIDAKLSGNIYDKVNYLCNFHGCDSMKELFGTILDEIKNQDKIEWEKNHIEEISRVETEISNYKGNDKYMLESNQRNLDRLKNQTYPGIYTWTYSSKLAEKLKVKAYYELDITAQKYINFSVDYKLRTSLINISGYDYLFTIGSINSDEIFDGKLIEQELSNDLYYSKYDYKNDKLIIYKEKIIFEEFELKEDFFNIYNIYKNNLNINRSIELKEKLQIEKEGIKVDLKILLEDFSILNPEYNGIDTSSYYLNGTVLLKEKK
ncbi:MAG: DUF4153 domain-containing protein [Candidatus Gracilibacteria bacterium]|nr:DUF4153 domain-containing protein [Candidatus Gracilibacteria bacterium]